MVWTNGDTHVEFGESETPDDRTGSVLVEASSDTGAGVDSDSDETLARAAAIGDRAAFDELVHRTLPVLLRYARRMTPDRQNAEDVVQETLIAAWKGLPRFGFQSSFRTWVFSIAHRKIIDLRRKHRDLAADDEFLAAVPSTSPTPIDDAMETSLMQALERELAELPYNSRAAWWLREMEGLSHPEIARILQITPGSVRGHLQRTRARLAERMEPWRPGGTGDPSASDVAEERDTPIPRDAPALGRGRTGVRAPREPRAGPGARRTSGEKPVDV